MAFGQFLPVGNVSRGHGITLHPIITCHNGGIMSASLESLQQIREPLALMCEELCQMSPEILKFCCLGEV